MELPWTLKLSPQDSHKSDSSDSLDSLFGEGKDSGDHANCLSSQLIKEEPDVCGVSDEKKSSLLAMSFSREEIDFAMSKLGEDAPINELVDFIFAAQIAEKCDKDAEELVCTGERKGCSTEALFGTMVKTLRLLEMGFSEQEISAAIEKYGSEVPIAKLADSIIADQNPDTRIKIEEYCSTSFTMDSSSSQNIYSSSGIGMRSGLGPHSFDLATVKTENCSVDDFPRSRDSDILEQLRGKRPIAERIDEPNILKRPKHEYEEDSSSSFNPAWLEIKSRNSAFSGRRRIPVSQRQVHHRAGLDASEMTKLSMPNSCKSLDRMVAKAPYFFYGNVMNLSHGSWVKISQFLYAIEPEFVNTQFFSALSRKEGYIHNLPSESRFHILPKPPMTIEDAIPHTRKWWPSWDTRKQLSCISSETSGVSQLCDRLRRILVDSGGFLSVEQQRDLLHHCRTLNLIWVGQHKLAPLEPEELERILSYPMHHTRASGFSLTERFQSLKHCFQIDTLAYHLSVLKPLFPGGVTVLSIYSGIGGAEIALHRLGIYLKGVVSVEPSEAKRKILKQWWGNSRQNGELVQLENIQRLGGSRLDSLIKKFGGFDFIVCQNPSPSAVADSDSLAGLDFTMFYEFVRVLQRVRSMMEKNR